MAGPLLEQKAWSAGDVLCWVLPPTCNIIEGVIARAIYSYLVIRVPLFQSGASTQVLCLSWAVVTVSPDPTWGLPKMWSR